MPGNKGGDGRQMNILAVILARGGSKGIPKKNITPVCGHPLISYSIAAALKSRYIDEIIVSTDSDDIAEVAKSYGAQVPFQRPAALSGDVVPSVDALRHAVVEYESCSNKSYDYIVELPCVSPLRDDSHIDDAIEKLIATKCDSVISMVSTGEKHPTRLKQIIDDEIVDMCDDFPEPAVGSRRQDLTPESYVRNGAIYAMTRETLVDNNSRHGSVSRPYVMSTNKSINIDELFDLDVAKLMINSGVCNNRPTKIKNIYESAKRTSLPRALITTPTYFMPDADDLLSSKFQCIFAPRADEAVIRDKIKDVDILICQPCPEYSIGSDILTSATNLKIIASTSTGTNHIDTQYCNDNNISVISLRASNATKSITASSEFTFGLMMSVVRKIPMALTSARAGRWREEEDSLRGMELRGKTLGIIGFGRIGENNARYACAFGMQVLAFDPNVRINNPDITQMQSYHDVLRAADVIMVSVHLDDSTKGMVDSEWFSTMKRGVCFINTSRGEIIDESALIEALDSGQVSAAGLDVISDELSGDKNTHPVIEYARKNNNLIVTPHIAGLTYESETKALLAVLDAIKDIL